MGRLRRWPALAVLVTALALSGCAGDDGGEDAQAEEAAALDRELWERSEELIEECMGEQGFDYVARAYPGAYRLAAAADSPADLTLEEAESGGFGFVDDVVRSVRSDDEDTDPNEEILEGLSEAEQTPYEVALHGSPQSGQDGCRQEADEEARSELSADLTPLMRNVDETIKRVEADQRYHELWAEWSDCMSDEGIEAGHIDELQADFVDRSGQLVTVDIPDDPAEEPSDPEPTVDMEAARELRAEEVAAAVASVRCLDPLRDDLDEIVEDARSESD